MHNSFTVPQWKEIGLFTKDCLNNMIFYEKKLDWIFISFHKQNSLQIDQGLKCES